MFLPVLSFDTEIPGDEPSRERTVFQDIPRGEGEVLFHLFPLPLLKNCLKCKPAFPAYP